MELPSTFSVKVFRLSIFGIKAKKKEDWPYSLIHYVQSCKSLPMIREKPSDANNTYQYRDVLSRGMNPKKQHEVDCLVEIISKLSNTENSGKFHIVDIGSGEVLIR